MNNFSMASLKANVLLQTANIKQERDRDTHIDEQHKQHHP